MLHALDESRYGVFDTTRGKSTFRGDVVTEVGNDQFIECLEKYYDAEAVADWRKLKEKMEPLARASSALPSRCGEDGYICSVDVG